MAEKMCRRISPAGGLGVSPNFQSPPKYGGLTGGLDNRFLQDWEGVDKANSSFPNRVATTNTKRHA